MTGFNVHRGVPRTLGNDLGPWGVWRFLGVRLGDVLGGWDGPLAGFRGQVGTQMGQDEAKLAPRSDKLGPK